MTESVIQSIIIPKKFMSKRRAIEWVKKHYRYEKIDETDNTYRFRQIDPKRLEKRGMIKYFTTSLSNGVQLIIAHN